VLIVEAETTDCEEGAALLFRLRDRDRARPAERDLEKKPPLPSLTFELSSLEGIVCDVLLYITLEFSFRMCWLKSMPIL